MPIRLMIISECVCFEGRAAVRSGDGAVPGQDGELAVLALHVGAVDGEHRDIAPTVRRRSRGLGARGHRRGQRDALPVGGERHGGPDPGPSETPTCSYASDRSDAPGGYDTQGSDFTPSGWAPFILSA